MTDKVPNRESLLFDKTKFHHMYEVFKLDIQRGRFFEDKNAVKIDDYADLVKKFEFLNYALVQFWRKDKAGDFFIVAKLAIQCPLMIKEQSDTGDQ